MSNLSTGELRRIEKQFADGIKSGQVVEIFKDRGHRFSEATLRKYVQLGLLPRSRRVGVRGRHRGSSGVYPIGIVRLINDIKQALDEGATLEEVRLGTVGLVGEVQTLRKCCEQVLHRFEEAVSQAGDKQRVSLSRGVVQQRRALSRVVQDLEKFAGRIGRREAR